MLINPVPNVAQVVMPSSQMDTAKKTWQTKWNLDVSVAYTRQLPKVGIKLHLSKYKEILHIGVSYLLLYDTAYPGGHS